MILYLLRHGTTSWNASHRIQGRSDIPLDAAGEEMARQTGIALTEAGIRFDAIWSSPLVRARRTAALAAPGVPVRTDPRLAELSFGTFEGKVTMDMHADPDCAFRFFRADPARYDAEIRLLKEREAGSCNDDIRQPEEPVDSQKPVIRFETLTDLCARTAQFMQDVIEPLVRTSPDSFSVLISGHGAANRALLMYILGEKNLQAFWGKGLQANCGITRIECRAGDLCGEPGTVSYQTDDLSMTFYDPDITRGMTSLL